MKNKLMHIVSLLLICLCIAAVSCAEVVDTSLPTFAWERNGTEHWRQLPTDERSEVAMHTLVENVCTVCGSEVWLFDDASADVSDYNDHEDLIRYTSFDSEGNITLEIMYAYEYDTEGNMLLSQEYSGNVLVSEITYTLNAQGEQVPVEQVSYNDDDTWSINEYDANGNMIHAAIYDTDGDVEYEEFSEYKMNSEGYYYESSKTALFAEGATFYSEYNEYGDTIRTRNAESDGTVWANEFYEYQYADGQKVWRKHYSNEILTTETYFQENGLAQKEIEYFEGGAWMVTDYNENADPVSVASYDADGQVESLMTYEYDYAEDMTWLATRAYTDGKLVIQTEYTVVEAGFSYASKETVYENDGSCIVFVFDENEEVLSETAYDAAGNVIQ